MNKSLLVLSLLVISASPLAAQQRSPNSMGGGDCNANVYNCADTPNPLPAPNTVWIEEMTDRKSTRLNSSHVRTSRMPSSA